jgi:plastocyanin
MRTYILSGLTMLFLLLQVSVFTFSGFPNEAYAQAIVHAKIQNFAFVPSDTTVTVGTTIEWTNLDSALHTVTSGTPGNPDGKFNSGDMSQNATFSFVFQTPGVYPYYCALHSFTGSVTVVQPVGVNEGKVLPWPIVLYQNTPNPFNGDTVISYNLRQKGDVTLTIYSMTGQKIWQKVEHSVSPGIHRVRWSVSNSPGVTLSTGIYFYSIENEGASVVGRMLYLK